MPRLEYDVVFNLDQTSVTRLRDTLDKLESGGGAGNEQLLKTLRETSDEAEEIGNNLSSSGKDLKRFKKDADKTHETMKSMGVSADRWAAAINSVSSGRMVTIGDAGDEIRVSLRSASRSGKELKDSLRLANSQLERTSQEAGTLKGRLTNLDDAMGGVRDSTTGVSKTANNANQILFSFGDAVQDGAQFQHSFGAGARAVGNNLTFASEQISLAVAKAGSFGGAMKSLGSALIGPAGIVLAINAAVTVLTVFGDELFGASEDASILNTELKTTSDFLSSIASESVDEFVRSSESLDKRINAVSDALENLFRQDAGLQSLPTPMMQLNSAAQSATNTVSSQTIPTTKALNKSLNLTAGTNTRIREETAQVLRNKLAELEAQKLFNEAIGDTLEKERQIFTIRKSQQRLREAGTDISVTGGQIEQPDIVGAGARHRAKQRQQFFNELGISEVEFERSIANKKVQIKKDEEQAKTNITARQARARRQLVTQAAAAGTAVLTASFGKTKEVRIAQALIDTYASAQAAYYSQLTASPDSPIRAALAAAAAVASGLARVATMRSIEPGSSSGSGGGSGGAVTRGRSPQRRTSITNERNRPPAFTRGDMDRGQKTVINVENRLDERGLAIKVRQGESKLGSQQVVLNND